MSNSAPQDQWLPAFVLPNVAFEEPVESRYVALVPRDDKRVTSLMSQHRPFEQFLSSFTDTLGRKIKPTVLMLAPRVVDAFRRGDTLASFRDVVAFSIIGHMRAQAMEDTPRSHLLWADYFSFHPWVIDKTFQFVVGDSLAMRNLDEPKDFRGQSSPEVVPQTVLPGDIDRPLMGRLIERWEDRFSGNVATRWEDIALFRSLNTAFRASRLPAGRELGVYDLGASITTWVSALEILAHTGPGGRSSLEAVYSLLEAVPWLHAESPTPRHATFVAPKKSEVMKCKASSVYGKLYLARNDFVHGNEISNQNDRIEKLFSLAPLVYRLALSSFLKLVPVEPGPDAAAEEQQKYSMAVLRQFIVERALLNASLA